MGREKRLREARQAQATLGDAPIEERFRDQMNILARALDINLNGLARGSDRKVGFVLLTFPFGHTVGACCNFISNSDRKDIVVLFKEMIARFEGQPEMEGRA